MKKLFNKAAAVILSVLLIFGCFAGCAKRPDDIVTPPGTEEPAVDETGAKGTHTAAQTPAEKGEVDMSGFVYEGPEEETVEIVPEQRPADVQTSTYYSVQDTFFREDGEAGHGADQTMLVNGSWRRRAYMKFELGESRPESTALAVLRLTATDVATGYRDGTRTISVYTLEDLQWNEDSTVEPQLGTFIVSFEVGKQNNAVYEIDLTDYIASFEGDTLGLALVNDHGSSDGKNSVSFYTREAGEAYAPRLTVTNYASSVEPTALKLSAETAVVSVGSSKKIAAALYPDYVYPRTISWTSSNPSVVSVSEGKLFGISAGEATVTASCGSLEETIAVTVVQQSPYGASLIPVADTYTHYMSSGATASASAASASETLAVVQKMNSSAETAEYGKAFLQFDLSAFPSSSYKDAILNLKIKSVAVNETPQISVYSINVTDVNALEYNTDSTSGTLIGTFSLNDKVADDTISFSLTSWLNVHAAEVGNTLTLRLQFSNVAQGGLNSVSFYSSESAANSPYLVLQEADSDAVVAEMLAYVDNIGTYNSVTKDTVDRLIEAESFYGSLTEEQKLLLPQNKIELMQRARYYFDAALALEGDVTVYSAAENFQSTISDNWQERYTVKANGTPVGLYPAETTYGGNAGAVGCYGIFDFSGTVTIEVSTNFDFENVDVRPLSAGIRVNRVGERTILFEMTEAKNLSIEFDEDLTHNLELFANEQADWSAYYTENEEQHVLQLKPGSHAVAQLLASLESGKRNVIRFMPGIHTLDDTLRLPSDTVCIIEGGAVVEGRIHAVEVNNVSILSRGVISGTKLSRQYSGSYGAAGDGPDSYFMRLLKCTNVYIDGVVLQDSPHWTFVPIECENVYVNGLRIVGQKRPNNDGMDIVNTRNITINNSFIRTIDDGITIKGKYLSAERGKVSDITVQNTVFWNYGAGQSITVGAETCADVYENVVFRNVDIVHNLWQTAINVNNMDSADFRNIVFDDIRIEDDKTNPSDQRGTLLGVNISDGYYSSDTDRGTIDGVIFNNIYYTGSYANSRSITFTGLDASHRIENVNFYNFRLNGSTLTDDSRIYKNAYVSEIGVLPSSYAFGANVVKGAAFFEAESVFSDFMQVRKDAAFSGVSYAELSMGYRESVTIAFEIAQTGHYIPKINFAKSASGGIFTVLVDGVRSGSPVDTYSTTSEQQEVAFPETFFTAGEHTVTIVYAGANPSSTGATLGVDYFNFVLPDDDTLEAEDLRTSASIVADGYAAGGYYVETRLAEGETLVLTGRNSEERIRTPRIRFLTGPDMPKVQVYVNGEALGEPVDLYAEEESFTEFEFDPVVLAQGSLRITIEYVGKNSASSGTRVCIDRFKFIPQARSVIWRTTRLGWKSASSGLTVAKSVNDMNGYVYTTMQADGQYLELYSDSPFAGVYKIVPLFKTGPDQGVFDVYVNDEYVNTVDLYSSSARDADIAVATVELGFTNTVKFVSAGKNEGSSARGISVYNVKLVPYSADFTNLNLLVQTENSVLLSAYTAVSAAAYSAALAQAKTLMKNAWAAEDQTAAAYCALVNAYLNLRPAAFSGAAAESVNLPETLTLSAGERIALGGVQPAGAEVVFTTDDPNVATVDYRGEVIARGDGTATISAYDTQGRRLAYTTVTVKTEYQTEIDVSAAKFASFTFGGVQSGDSVTLSVMRGGVEVGSLHATLDATCSVSADLARLGIDVNGTYAFTFRATRMNEFVNGASIIRGEFFETDTDYLAGAWSADAGITVAKDETGVRFGKTYSVSDVWYGVAVQRVRLDLDENPYLIIDVDELDGLFALKIVRAGDSKEISLINDTGAKGEYLFDLSSYLDESGEYDIRIYCVKKAESDTSAYVHVAQLGLLGPGAVLVQK